MDDKTGIDDADMAQALSARAGDLRAFAGLVRRHQDRMFGFLLRMLGPTSSFSRTGLSPTTATLSRAFR